MRLNLLLWLTRVQLRDIFTIRPDTACHSHDLLDCPCDRIGMSGDNDAPSTADVALEDDSRLSADTTSGFVVASQVKIVDTPKFDKAVCGFFLRPEQCSHVYVCYQYLKKKKAELAALGEWTHINCLRPDASERVHDDMLRSLLYRSSSSHKQQVDPADGSSKSRIISLLDAVDLDNVSGLEDLTVMDVPGGTVSFLFEKGTSMSRDEVEVENSVPL
jgi:DNA repair and recombination protein RAD54B